MIAFRQQRWTYDVFFDGISLNCMKNNLLIISELIEIDTEIIFIFCNKIMKSPTLLMQNKIIIPPTGVDHSKQQKTPIKQHRKTNANRQEESDVDFSKSIKNAQSKEGSLRTTIESTTRKYQSEKNQKFQSFLRSTVTSSFTINSPKDSCTEPKMSKKTSLPECNFDSRKIHPVKHQNGGHDSTKNIQNSDANYNKIMQKIDKKQKLINELKKLSGAIITQTMKTFTQLQKFDKKDYDYHKKQEELSSGSLTSKHFKQSLRETFDQFNKSPLDNNNKSKNDKSFTRIKEKILLKECAEKQEKVPFKKQDEAIKKCIQTHFNAKIEKLETKQTTEVKIESEKKLSKKPPGLKNSHDHEQYKSCHDQVLTKSDHISSKLITEAKSNNANQKSKDNGSPELKNIKQMHFIKDFQVQRSLGQGKFGVVYQVIHKATKTIYALKKMSKQVIKENCLVDQFIQEIKIQSYCDHENILQLYGFFHDQEYFYLILEYMEEGTLFSQLKKSQLEAAVKLKHLAEGVKYLHAQGIAHRDIKPENIVMSNGVGKLCDFGWAAICTERRKTYCGTFDYVAPQILQGEEYDMSVDLWCLGVLAYELLVGKAPFYHVSRKQTMKRIINVESTALEFPSHLSKTSITFIERLIKRNPQQRMTAQDILKHPFLLQIKQKSI